MAPLAGVELAMAGEGPAVGGAVRTATGWACRLGAAPVASGPGAELSGAAGDLPGVPRGVVDLAGAGALLGAALAGWWSGRRLGVDLGAVAAQVALPLVVAARTGSAVAAAPSAPRAWGRGAVCADLGGGDDAEAFERLLAVEGAGAPGPEELARAAQGWRLPVTPYRRSAPALGPWCDQVFEVRHLGGGPRGRGGPAGAAGAAPLAGVTVVDLTLMWSGPLATWLLASLGASVVKVEPACRPDGLRSGPGGHLFEALNAGKVGADLDLRGAAGRSAFDELAAGADLLVDNLSPRAVANLGLDEASLAAQHPGLLALGLPAYPAGSPERDWVAYGTGVHATSGLGWARSGPVAPAVTYPDPVTGFSAFAAAMALLVGRVASGRVWRRAEVPMAVAVAPLARVGGPASGSGPLACREPGLGERLARHHRVPFGGEGVPAALGPAPAWPGGGRG